MQFPATKSLDEFLADRRHFARSTCAKDSVDVFGTDLSGTQCFVESRGDLFKRGRGVVFELRAKDRFVNLDVGILEAKLRGRA